ncbi:hypothetical protein SBRY_110208 [Actinacidiphila bryophytorum]|uniref:Uncharacterized protein n=1 Tax=Actinacidiphila bryophytorum TaxID=1436133 RepID=A0A9W4E4R6_9ACTN|nr:hypothetical protein SBRY_110208 [Actinacidiphila bryophytorum]
MAVLLRRQPVQRRHRQLHHHVQGDPDRRLPQPRQLRRRPDQHGRADRRHQLRDVLRLLLRLVLLLVRQRRPRLRHPGQHRQGRPREPARRRHEPMTCAMRR